MCAYHDIGIPRRTASNKIDATTNGGDALNILPHEKRCAIIRCLVDGCSVRATGRITGATKNTIQKLTRDLGQACLEFQDNALRNLTCQRIQADEIWNFCYAKEKNLPDRMRGQPGIGSMWTWTAMCGDTKVIERCAAIQRSIVLALAERTTPTPSCRTFLGGWPIGYN